MRDKASDREGAKKPPFDRDQPSESPGQRGKDDTTDTGRAVAPRFDEGGPKLSPIEGTADDGVRQPAGSTPVRSKRQQPGDADKSTEATMPPGQGTDPKRNTL